MIRGLLASVLVWLFAHPVFGQMAADIARGTPAETVIRTHGWPRGKSTANGRESWLYDRFQVLFEDGKVVSVSLISPASPGSTKNIPLANGASVSKPGSPAGSTESPRAGSPQSENSRPATNHATAEKPVGASSEPMFSRPVLWGVVIVGALGFGAALIVPLFIQRGKAGSANDQNVRVPLARTQAPIATPTPFDAPAAQERRATLNGSLARRKGEVGTSPGSRGEPPATGTGASG